MGLTWRNVLKIMVVVGLAILSVSPAKATIYSFVDENGSLHFSNAPQDSRYRPGIRTTSYAKPQGNEFFLYDKHIRRAARIYDVDPLLVKAIIKAESNFDRLALSKRGAKGLMQLMPETALDMNVEDPYDPRGNILGGTCYLRKLLGLFDGDLALALAAYNAGPERVKKNGRVPQIAETKKYVKKVLKNYKQFQAISSSQ